MADNVITMRNVQVVQSAKETLNISRVHFKQITSVIYVPVKMH